MTFRLSFWAALFLLVPSALLGDEWASYATIGVEPSAGRLCAGASNGKDIVCVSPAPYLDPNTGYVGIGTTSPTSALEVAGNIVLSSGANRTITSSSGDLQFLTTNATAGEADVRIELPAANNNRFAVRSTGSEFFTVRDTGNVGIGTVSPNHKLDVVGNIGLSASGYLNFGASDGSTGYGLRDNAGTLEYKNSGGSWTVLGMSSLFAAGLVSAPGLAVSGDSDTGLYSPSANTLSVTAGGKEVARFNTATSGVNYFALTPSAAGSALQLGAAGSDTNVSIALMPKGTGYVGIGTTGAAPIVGGALVNVAGIIASTGTAGGKVIALNPLNQSASVMLDWYNDGANDWPRLRYGGTGSGSANGFLIQGPGDDVKLAVLQSGNVGIGTATPQAMLDIFSDSTGYALKLGRLDIPRFWGAKVSNDGAFNLLDATASLTRLTILPGAGTTGGNVGIGTSAPVTKLDVSGGIKVAGASETCTVAADIGKIRYNSTTGRFQVCRP